jgi:hypothetical protein
MACPDCGSSLGEYRIASSVETHGLDCGPYERFEHEFVVCRECGERCDARDWETAPEVSCAVPERLLLFGGSLVDRVNNCANDNDE